jgi:O-succinylbenzoate synthase
MGVIIEDADVEEEEDEMSQYMGAELVEGDPDQLYASESAHLPIGVDIGS